MLIFLQLYYFPMATNMNHTEFSEKATQILNQGNLPVDTNGAILYTTFDTVRKGDYYIIGLNPGGNPNQPDDKYPLYSEMTIEKSLKECKLQDYNEYTKIWIEGRPLMPLQRNVNYLAEKFLQKDSIEICCTNLIFKVTKDAVKLTPEFDVLANLCWDVHKMLLDIIQPRIIIAFGNQDKLSPFHFLRHKAGFPTLKERLANHGKYYRIKYFKGTIEGRETIVLGLPHLSRYCIYNGNKDVIINEIFAEIAA